MILTSRPATDRDERGAEERQQLIKSWEKASPTIKLYSILAMTISYLIALVVLMTLPATGGELEQTPLWLSLVEIAALVEVCSIFFFIIAIHLLQFSDMLTEERRRCSIIRLGWALIILIMLLWWTSVLFALQTVPSCNVDSTWLSSLAASAPKDDWTLAETTLDNCRHSLASLSLAVINTVILAITIPTALADYTWHKTSAVYISQNELGLGAQLEAHVFYSLFWTPFPWPEQRL